VELAEIIAAIRMRLLDDQRLKLDMVIGWQQMRAQIV
jgi:hypothetical protein